MRDPRRTRRGAGDVSSSAPTPGELHAAAHDVLVQLQRLATAWRFDLRPAACEVDAVARRVAVLHGHVARLTTDRGAVSPDDRAELAEARDRLREAAALASRLVATLRPPPDAGREAGTG